MPALVAGIHVFIAAPLANKTWMAGTSPAMTPKKWFNTTGTRCNHAHRRIALGLTVPVHQFAVMPPEATQVVLVHRIAGRSTVGQDLIAMHTATDELPLVALR